MLFFCTSLHVETGIVMGVPDLGTINTFVDVDVITVLEQ
jgi:hypothetical protein